ncbi:MAG: adenylate/guanylate cyclase domain-containing protein, partial [Pseudobdellovibrionaceae bacterium]|nr:adenylate/guanylate cyclase domain-containing protein [Pseudobdellovibrionaceae bacterium]
ILLGNMKLDTDPAEKHITVLFADICQFTKATEQLGIEKISIVLNQFLSTMTDIVFEHRGTIDKFIGDSIMVVFGAPADMSGEEQAQQVVATAKAMMRALTELNREWERNGLGSFEMHIGIHTGMAIVGNFGSKKRSDYTAIGNTVNIAARLEKFAKANQIVLSAAVRAYLPHDETRSMGLYELKGIEKPIEVYTLVSHESDSDVVQRKSKSAS